MSDKEEGLLAVIRLRGRVDQSKRKRTILKLLNLTRANHAAIIPNDKTHRGMLLKVQDAVTWGEINKTTAKELLRKRGRITGNKPLTRSFLKQYDFKSIPDFTNALFEGKADMRRIEDLKPIFRLHPPRKGFRSVKKPYALKGDLGYRGEEINKLIERMM